MNMWGESKEHEGVPLALAEGVSKESKKRGGGMSMVIPQKKGGL